MLRFHHHILAFILKGLFRKWNGELTDYDWVPGKRFGNTLSFENWTHESIHTTELTIIST